MIKVLFDLSKEYHFNSLFPLYKEMEKDPKYDLRIHVGKDSKRLLGIFQIPDKNRIASNLKKEGYKLTNETSGWDILVVADAVREHKKYGEVVRIHLDHGVGIKTSRIRNIVKQKELRYHVFLEGRYWFDYIKSLGWKNKADFHIFGSPKLDLLFWKDYYDNNTLKAMLELDPNKKTVLFAPSYKPSCIEFLQGKISDLIPEYNVIIKLHPYSWGTKYAPSSHFKFYEKLSKKFKDVFLITKQDYDIYPYLFLADTLISDTSSVINEFLALGKFGIIYVLPHFKEKHSDGMEVLSVAPKDWLEGAFPHMFSPDDLILAVESALNPTKEMEQKLKKNRDYFFVGLDGKSSLRVKKKIDEIINK